MNIKNFSFDMEETPEVNAHSLWCERYRPRNIEDFIGNSTIKESLKLWLEKKEIPHLLFFSC